MKEVLGGNCKKWYAVITKPNQENIAEDNLQRQGYNCFLPRAINPRQVRNRKKKILVEPLFPRYLFINVNSSEKSIAPVRSTRGVNGMIRFGKRIAEVPEKVIDQIKARLNDNGIVEIEPLSFDIGDRVCVFDGPLAGLEGIFTDVVGKGRALLLMEFLTGASTVRVDRNLLKRAS